MSSSRALFLDRDGVINRDLNFVWRVEDFEFVDGIFELCRLAISKSYLIIVVTNQSGIARGYYRERDFLGLTTWMENQFLLNDVEVTKTYYCPHLTDAAVMDYRLECACRKPSPGMLLAAAHQFCVELEQSVIIGDRPSDMLAGKAAGVSTRLLLGASEKEACEMATACIRRLKDAHNFL